MKQIPQVKLFWPLFVAAGLVLPQTSQAQDPITLAIQQGIKKVIVAIDLKIQRLQNKTIWLQNAQKTIENELSKLKLAEIGDWVERQRSLYANYFEELWRVKTTIAGYHKIREIIRKQKLLVEEYGKAYALFKKDPQFTSGEIQTMYKIYSGILQQGLHNLDVLALVINAFTTQMSDAARLQLIDQAGERLDRQLADLRQFNMSNKMISLQRATEKGEIRRFKSIYGL